MTRQSLVVLIGERLSAPAGLGVQAPNARRSVERVSSRKPERDRDAPPAHHPRCASRPAGTSSSRSRPSCATTCSSRWAASQERFPGIVGFDETVLPQVERALLAGHDVVLLGERGQGKTRLIRTLVGLLDEWTPVVAGCEINDHPYAPVCGRCLELEAELGDELPVSLEAPQRAIRREARDPRHQRRRPDRRHRPDQGRRGPHPRRPADRPLRPGPAYQPRHLQRQRASRPRRAHPGRAAQRARGARHPGPRLRAAAAARPAARREREPGGLHQPRPDHHPAEGPLRRRGPHPLPAAPGRRARAHAPGVADRSGTGPSGSRSCPTTSSRCSPASPGPCARRRRSTAARASRPGSRSPPPRRWPPAPFAARP